jgi:hypothetical protein
MVCFRYISVNTLRKGDNVIMMIIIIRRRRRRRDMPEWFCNPFEN